MPPKFNRDRGVLTEKDRRYLRNGELPESKQGRYDRKASARERIENSIIDFHDVRLMPKQERRKIFDDMEYDDQLYYGLIAMISFAIYGAKDAGISEETLLEDAAKLATHGPRLPSGAEVSDEDMEKHEDTSGRLLDDVTVNIERHWVDVMYPHQILERLRDGDDLDAEEIGVLLLSGVVDETNSWKLLEERFPEGAYNA